MSQPSLTLSLATDPVLDAERRRGLRQMRLVALSLLVCAAIVFLATLRVADQGFWGFVHAGAEGGSDLAIAVFPEEGDDIRREELLAEEYRIALRPDHPAIAGFDLDRWLAYPHVLVSGRGETRSPLDGELARLGRSRRVGLVLPSFGMVADVLRGSDMIAMLPSRVIRAVGDLVDLPPPIPVAGFPLHLAWHRRREKDAGLQHVARLLAGLLR